MNRDFLTYMVEGIVFSSSVSIKCLRSPHFAATTLIRDFNCYRLSQYFFCYRYPVNCCTILRHHLHLMIRYIIFSIFDSYQQQNPIDLVIYCYQIRSSKYRSESIPCMHMNQPQRSHDFLEQLLSLIMPVTDQGRNSLMSTILSVAQSILFAVQKSNILYHYFLASFSCCPIFFCIQFIRCIIAYSYDNLHSVWRLTQKHSEYFGY